jgi:hypothetical protein
MSFGNYNGEPRTLYRRTNGITTPYKLPYLTGMQKPVGYMGMYHWEDFYNTKPIACMRGNPDIRSIIPLVCRPNPAEVERRKAEGLKTVLGVDKPITEVVTDANGDMVAIDENGDVAATKKAAPNIMPIALAAAAAWFFLM